MTWTKLDDGFWRNPKIARLDPYEFRLYVVMLNWCCDQLTDGHFRHSDVARILHHDRRTTVRLLESLCNYGAIHVAEETQDVQYCFPDFLDFQPSKDDVTARQKAWRNQKRKQRMSPADTPQDSAEESTAVSLHPSRPVPSESYKQDSVRALSPVENPPEGPPDELLNTAQRGYLNDRYGTALVDEAIEEVEWRIRTGTNPPKNPGAMITLIAGCYADQCDSAKYHGEYHGPAAAIEHRGRRADHDQEQRAHA